MVPKYEFKKKEEQRVSEKRLIPGPEHKIYKITMEVFITPEKECTGVTLKDLEVNLNRFSLAKDGAIQARIGLQHQ